MDRPRGGSGRQQRVIAAQRREWETKRDAELRGLSPDKRVAVHTAHQFQDSGPACRLFCAVGTRTRLALLPTSFLSSSPATVRSARTGAVREISVGVECGPQAWPDTAACRWRRKRATVADR